MSNLFQQREISEAIQAGNEALRCLENAKDFLGSAGNWGLLDIFGGGAAHHICQALQDEPG